MQLPQFIVNDWQRKLAALFFALLIWYFVSMQIQERRTIPNVSIDFQPGSPQIELVNEAAVPQITLTLRGSNRSLDKISSSNILVTHTLDPDAKAGEYTAIIRDSDVQLPRGVHLIDVKPRQVSVSVDRIVTKTVPVRPIFEGSLPDGKDWKIRRVTPSEVKVTGPSRLLTGLSELTSEPLQLGSNVPNLFDRNIRLQVPPGIKADLGPDQVVNLYVELTSTGDSKLISPISIHVLNRPDSPFEVESIPAEQFPEAEGSQRDRRFVTARISGPRELIDRIGEETTRAYVDISTVQKPGPADLPVHLSLNAREVRIVEIRPARIQVIVRAKE